MALDTDFAVIDVETTGLFPNRHDRIIEIAALRVRPNGSIINEYSTLLNPRRDVGPAHVHGISARQVSRAPFFEDALGDIVSILAGAVFVAHNVHFDLRFLKSEMSRVGCDPPEFPYLCTMQLSRRIDPNLPSRKLGVLCSHFNIQHSREHSAYADARATAALFSICIEKLGGSETLCTEDIGVKGKLIGRNAWPSLKTGSKPYPRKEALRIPASGSGYLTRLVRKLPVMCELTAECDEYLSMLDSALEDRQITASEARELLHVAEGLGISRQRAIRIHQTYMRDLIRVAFEDGIITDQEQEDLDEVRELLGVPLIHYRQIFAEVAKARRCESDLHGPVLTNRIDVEGRSVCFTGQLLGSIDGARVTRSRAEQIAAQKGMVVKHGVTRDLDFLVVADPNTMSGKAKQARAYGIRIIAEMVFWRLAGVEVD